MCFNESSLVIFILFIVIGVVGLGWVIYKSSPNIDSWEAGIKSIFLFLRDCFYEEFTGKTLPEKQINTNLLLNRTQMNELKNMLKDSPYKRPYMDESSVIVMDGIVTFTVNSVGFANDYRALDIDIIKELCRNVIREYLEDFVNPKDLVVVITACTPTTLKFKFPLNEIGRRKLEGETKHTSKPKDEEIELEEEIDLWGE